MVVTTLEEVTQSEVLGAAKLDPQFFCSFYFILLFIFFAFDGTDVVTSSSVIKQKRLVSTLFWPPDYVLISRSRTSEEVRPAPIIHFTLEDSHSSAFCSTQLQQ